MRLALLCLALGGCAGPCKQVYAAYHECHMEEYYECPDGARTGGVIVYGKRERPECYIAEEN